MATKPMPISSWLKEWGTAVCKEKSGKTLAEWEALWLERRIEGFNTGKLSLDKMYSPDAMSLLSRIYGFDAGDVLCQEVPTGILEKHNPKYKAPSFDGELATKAIGYRLNPDRFPNS